MDQNELIRYRGNYSVEELAQILNVNKEDVEKWEETGEIDEQTFIDLKEMYEEECNIPNFVLEMQKIHTSMSRGQIIWNRIPYPLVALAIFLVLGFTMKAWHPAWAIFLSIPVYYSLGSSIFRRSLALFNYPCIAIGIYVLLGFICDLWSPGWLIFLTIPFYYLICFSIAARKFTFIVYANFILIIYLTMGMVFDMWHPWWVLFLTIVTYISISKAISYKFAWYLDLCFLLVGIYVLCGVYTGLWHPLWVMLLLIPIYHIPQFIMIYKRKKALHIIKKKQD